jgi:hypothetical protein
LHNWEFSFKAREAFGANSPFQRTKGVPNKLFELKFIEERKPFSLYKYRALAQFEKK